MKIVDDRTNLIEALDDPRTVLLLFFGETDSTVEKVHAEAEVCAIGNRKVFWVTHLSALTASEQKEWHKADDHFTVLGVSDPGGMRKIVAQRPLSALCSKSGDPSARKIQGIFEEAEE